MVKESEGYVRAFVTRIGRHDKKNFLVHYYTEGITAISDIDFQAVTDGTLNFADSEYEKFIDIRIFDDMQEEKDETFVIQLSNPSQGNIYTIEMNFFWIIYRYHLFIICS